MIQEKIRPFLESISDQKESENLAVMYYECLKDDDVRTMRTTKMKTANTGETTIES